MSLVQTADQYEFLFKCVVEYLERGMILFPPPPPLSYLSTTPHPPPLLPLLPPPSLLLFSLATLLFSVLPNTVFPFYFSPPCYFPYHYPLSPSTLNYCTLTLLHSFFRISLHVIHPPISPFRQSTSLTPPYPIYLPYPSLPHLPLPYPSLPHLPPLLLPNPFAPPLSLLYPSLPSLTRSLAVTLRL